MTGSPVVPVVVPIVAFVFLFLWLRMVYYAAAHPTVQAHQVRAGHEEGEAIAHGSSAQERSAEDRQAA